MQVKQYEIWIADLNPKFGTEAGKKRPVIIIQTDLLNDFHPSVVICPITTNIQPNAELLRVLLKKSKVKIKVDSDVMIDQIRAIDKRRLITKVGKVPEQTAEKIRESLRVLLDC